MYNPGMPGMPMPQPPVGPPPMPMTPAVRKADELGPGAEKKPRTEEPEWPLTDPVSILYIINNSSKTYNINLECHHSYYSNTFFTR